MKRERMCEIRGDVIAVTDPADNSFDAQTESLLDNPSNIDIENNPGSPSSYHDPSFEHLSMQKHKRKRDIIDLQSKEQEPNGRDQVSNAKRPNRVYSYKQKLEMVRQSDNAPDSKVLAAQLGVSYSSLRKWKQEEARLIRMVEQEGKGDHNHGQVYSLAEKLEIVRKLENASNLSALAAQLGVRDNSLRAWKKEKAQLIQMVEHEGKGNRKHAKIHHRKADPVDPLLPVKRDLISFVDGVRGKQPEKITGSFISAKAKQIRDVIMAQHQQVPFLTEAEVKGMARFKATKPWGNCMIRMHGWRKSDEDLPDAAEYLQKLPAIPADDDTGSRVFTLAEKLTFVRAVTSKNAPTMCSLEKQYKLPGNTISRWKMNKAELMDRWSREAELKKR